MRAERENGEIRRLVGLRYEVGEGLPSVVFKAAGEPADAILRQREAALGAPLVRDPALARALYRLPIDASIGRDLFGAVAAVLVHVFSVDGSLEGSDV